MSFKLDILAIHPSCVVATNRGILRELMKRGLSVELVVPGNAEGLASNAILEPEIAGDPAIHILQPKFSIQPSRRRTFSGLRKLIALKRPRYVWIEDEPASLLAWQLGGLKQLYGFDLISFSVENMDLSFGEALRTSQTKRYIRNELLALATRMSRLVADKVLVCSRDGERLMQERGFRDAVLRTPIGYNPEIFRVDDALREKVRQTLGLNQFTIAYFGRVVPEKGVEDLIRALGALKDFQWQLLLDRFSSYQSPFATVLEQAIDEIGIRDRVVFFDAKHHEMPGFMNAADLVVAPSRNTPHFKEQYGRVVPEALACGCEVIVTRAGTLPELVGGEGYIVEAGDLDNLSKTIRERVEASRTFDSAGQNRTSRARTLSLIEQANLLEAWLT